MATKKEINQTAKLWLEYYPTLIQWGQFLIKRYDCLIVGICIDKTTDKTEYYPTFFIFNLFTNMPCLAFAYCSYSIKRFVPDSFKYGVDISSANQYLVENTPILQHINERFTFDDYMEHIIHTFNSENLYYRKNGIAETYFEILTVSNYLGCGDYYFSHIEKMKANMRLDKFSIDIDNWEKEIFNTINGNMEEIIQKIMIEIGLPPELENHKLIYQNDKIEFIDKIKSLTALY
ncbi:hypothetical protein [Moraxella equi]|uniref:Uncharacterized protein n=1 Tax=Moraxella equi TaxID=60442 RepID=A0A378QNH2_9GAMM|nr:hypothetical protein [Moraxella equi]OPH39990.1 hypothetical protein B5J93_01330 [Moraxella equi]STZ01844.1 Uncharacterised protein [Moraxella equi]